ncbi:MAG: hypothetical protein IT364_16120 [Candidatus Hydrogenedentes bacterium]|nr:hypothetical protein [Candidatus Hydrogenedentota bacterium]
MIRATEWVGDHMPYVYVVLKNGTSVAVPDADKADWETERESINRMGSSMASNPSAMRLVCRNGENVIAKFNEKDVAGWVWHDGKLA